MSAGVGEDRGGHGRPLSPRPRRRGGGWGGTSPCSDWSEEQDEETDRSGLGGLAGSAGVPSGWVAKAQGESGGFLSLFTFLRYLFLFYSAF